MTTKSLEDRFWSFVDTTGSCWTWTGGKCYGYGRFSVSGVTKQAHRVGYELQVGPIPPDMMLDHICHNPACVRGDHLRPVTNKQNQENRLQRDIANSGIRGVSYYPGRGKWKAAFKHNQRTIHVGLV